MRFSDREERAFADIFGYDGLSPFEEKRMKAMRDANEMLDCRDPDHKGCPACNPEDEE
jgi:hypothetical protein